MPNFTGLFRAEVARLARKQAKVELEQVKRASVQYRRDIAELKRKIAVQMRKLSFLEKQESRRVARPGNGVAADKGVRFSPMWLKKHREKLGLSAQEYGQLIGVTGQSIYMWERGNTKPRQSQITALAGIRGIGKREAQRRLELLVS